MAIVAVAAGAVWLQAQRGGGPPISWSQPEVLEFLVPDEGRRHHGQALHSAVHPTARPPLGG
jgi:hypothetical protein